MHLLENCTCTMGRCEPWTFIAWNWHHVHRIANHRQPTLLPVCRQRAQRL